MQEKITRGRQAFDIVDHTTVLCRLQKSYGVCGRVLSWFTSYLTGGMQYVRTMASSSVPSAVFYGVPQVSVLGPMLMLSHISQYQTYRYYQSCLEDLLWPPYAIGQAIIFLPCDFYLSVFYLLFFSRLISAVGDWMSTILPHMV